MQIATIGRGTTFHLLGLAPIASYGVNAGSDTGKGYVSYMAESACPTLTRNGHLKSVISTSEFVRNADGSGRGRYVFTPREFTFAEAVAYSEKMGQTICASCSKAAIHHHV